MTTCHSLMAIIEELKSDAQLIERQSVDRLAQLVHSASRVFVAGAGRSGFAARAFANRLMHLGYSVFFVGEPTTPSIRQGDLLVIGSGSGETASLVSMAKKAKAEGANIATLTIYPDHSIGKMASVSIRIPGVTKKSTEGSGKASSVQPSGSSFEQLSWLIYDSIIVDLKALSGQNDDQMYYRHANLE
ncbi:6-phospho 3-hexuloisomerase [Izhakiella australiensis]|uniref:6-phospho 3-hexuloisomerase n=1 Tax=Izhakiella australiensis TaxID=1926881 RepID=A0A1S8YT61_9GAMM|nr:6-phospho-3-hexuloisomerase [Izhakiella australiensis]OON42026.1 6-phospho 3-hexuloisomerase [Izhakiella australiensis]